MLDRDFVEIKEELERLYKKVDKVLGNYDRVGYENEKVYQMLEDNSGRLETMSNFISYFNRSFYRDVLVLRPDGRYGCSSTDKYYTCGSTMEAYAEPYSYCEENIALCYGRVEYSDEMGGYYFKNYDGKDVTLYEGMRVLVREERY